MTKPLPIESLRVIPLTALLLAGCAASGKQPPPEPMAPPVRSAPIAEDRSESDGASDSSEHSERPHAVNFFVGGSSEIGDLDGITFGVDYGYRLTSRWSVGAFAEAISGLDRSFATGLQGYYRVTEEFILMAGPGMEQSGEGWGPFARFGTAYEFRLADQWTLAPAIFYDFTERENVLVYGLNLGFLW